MFVQLKKKHHSEINNSGMFLNELLLPSSEDAPEPFRFSRNNNQLSSTACKCYNIVCYRKRLTDNKAVR